MDELDEIARMELQPGWDVFDGDGERVGEIAEVHDESFTVRTTSAHIAVAFSDIESADDGRVTLSVPGEDLAVGLDAL